MRIVAQRLQDEGGFADAGIAADQQRRARHQPAAGDAVEFGDAGDAAGRRRVFGLQIFQRESAALEPACAALPPMGGGGAFLGDGVPAAAGFALARPFGWVAPQDWQTKVAEDLAMPYEYKKSKLCACEGF